MLYDAEPKSAPLTVMLDCPEAATLPDINPPCTAKSYVAKPDNEPVVRWTENESKRDCRIPEPKKHLTEVSDSHSVASHPVCPSRIPP
eukprot:3151442-Rhodomonas_salina.1